MTLKSIVLYNNCTLVYDQINGNLTGNFKDFLQTVENQHARGIQLNSHKSRN